MEEEANNIITIGSFARLITALHRPFSFLYFRTFCPYFFLATSTCSLDKPIMSKLFAGIGEGAGKIKHCCGWFFLKIQPFVKQRKIVFLQIKDFNRCKFVHAKTLYILITKYTKNTKRIKCLPGLIPRRGQ